MITFSLPIPNLLIAYRHSVVNIISVYHLFPSLTHTLPVFFPFWSSPFTFEVINHLISARLTFTHARWHVLVHPFMLTGSSINQALTTAHACQVFFNPLLIFSRRCCVSAFTYSQSMSCNLHTSRVFLVFQCVPSVGWESWPWQTCPGMQKSYRWNLSTIFWNKPTASKPSTTYDLPLYHKPC